MSVCAGIGEVGGVDPMSDEQQSPKRGRFAGCLALVLLLGLPAYVLSIGPFVWLVDHGYVSRYVGVIYAPLGLLVSYCEPVGQMFRWYLAWWQ
jgi:hypothetical protein